MRSICPVFRSTKFRKYLERTARDHHRITPMNIADWGLYLVTGEAHSEGKTTVEVAEAAIEGGADVVQLRDKAHDARTRYEIGRELRDLTDETGADLVVNDRVDLALALGADGVHLGQGDLPVAVARAMLGEDAIVGRSVSSPAEARRAVDAGADYLGVGAVFGTDSKDLDAARDGIGVDAVREIDEAVDLPIVAIGGIDATNAGGVVEAGADAVAVISALTRADDVEAAARELVGAVDPDRPAAGPSLD